VSDQLYTIGQLAELTGVAPSAIRYYEELGLMPRAHRVSGQRRYGQASVDLVGMILVFRDMGFSLSEMKTLTSSRSRSSGAWRELADHKLTELEEHIYRAQIARVALQHALRCKYQDLADCPNFADVIAAKLAGEPLERAHSQRTVEKRESSAGGGPPSTRHGHRR
jgi:DNA-binding transcriptional MerR regulator